jgi:hypothetical protein
MVEYFEWCWDTRNKLAHAEHYPVSFGRLTPEILHLSKRLGRKNLKRG